MTTTNDMASRLS